MYRQEDFDKITSNLSRIYADADKVYKDKYEVPTKKEYDNVVNDIKNFIKNKGLIIYGGWAQNELIGKKNKDDEFYPETSRHDIEIYSTNPIKHVMELGDLLYSKKYNPIYIEEGVHNETYKLFVNFVNIADISYMDPHIFNNCPHITVDGLKLTHPHLMIVDAYRVYADPMTSYFRLEKAFKRSSTLMKYYPFDSKAEYNKLSYQKTPENDMLLRFIRKHIIMDSKLIVIGHYAYNYLVKKLDDKHSIDFNYIQLVSTDFKKDFEKVNKILKDKFGKKIYYKKYYPFFQFYDERVEFSYNNKVILKLYGNNNRCIVHRYSDKKKTYFGTFLLTMLYLLVDYNFAIINKDKSEEMNYLALIVRLYNIRNKYLDSKNVSILDDTPFKEFTLKCTGTPVDPIRSSRLKQAEKRKTGKRSKFSYTPTGKSANVPNFKFDISSGKEITKR
jgi:hypothetical protein